MLECVVNLSEGRDRVLVDEIARAGAPSLLDLHSDPWHNRSVLTLAGPHLATSLRSLSRAAAGLLDLRVHEGVHPRIGVLDVVPFAPVGPRAFVDPLDEAVAARDEFARWAGEDLALPCFLCGPERSLPEVRRSAWSTLAPDTGPRVPHPTAGAACVGARRPLVAFNLWLASPDVALARHVAAAVRGPGVRALGLPVGDTAQVSCNLVSPLETGPGALYDAVSSLAPVEHAELVGLVPLAVLEREPRGRWARLDLSEDRTVESRLASLR